MSLLLAALDLVDDLSPSLWAALFCGVFALLLVALRTERTDDDKEDTP